MFIDTPYSNRRNLSLLSAILAGLVLAAYSAHAQDIGPDLRGTGGTYYLVAFPDTTTNALDSRYPNTRVRTEASLWIFSAVKNRVKISANGTVVNTLTLEAGKFKIYQIPGSIVCDISGSPVNRSLAIESDFPIVLTCYFAHIQSLEAWSPLPVDRWGSAYHAAAVPGEIVREIGVAGETEVPVDPKPGPAEILVIAAYDNTTVTLTPPPGTIFAGGSAQTVTLNEGQVYQVQSAVKLDAAAKQQDIGATTIRADKPVGVISGNTRAQVYPAEEGLKNNAYKNLMIEWLRPDEQYGREFVYLPTWDSHRFGIGAAAERTSEYVRVYSGSKPVTGGYLRTDSGSAVPKTIPFTVRKDSLWELATPDVAAVYLHTSEPAQVMMHSSAIIQFNGSTPCFRGLPCLSYSAWAPYMVELVPREQWASFAPYYAPANPGGMQHYINVVTDSNSAQKIIQENGSTFLFSRRIPGTDLVWGSKSVSQGEDHWLIGKDGAKFSGFVYGIFSGGEEYRPGRAKKKDDAPSTASGGDRRAPDALHPCEYEEYNALSYGYPLVAMDIVNRPADSLVIDSVRDCASLRLTLSMVNANPSGFASVTLDPATVHNARLTPIDPQRLPDIMGRTRVEFTIEPIDLAAPATGTLVIIDRTGKTRSIPFTITATNPKVSPAGAGVFGDVVFNAGTVRSITITDTLAVPITITSISSTNGGIFHVVAPAQSALPLTIAPGDSLVVKVNALPVLHGAANYSGTLDIIHSCGIISVPLSAAASEPNIVAYDVDFGVVRTATAPITRMLRFCNLNRGWVVLANPGNGPILEWNGSAFTIADSDLTRLKGLRLEVGTCDSIPVTFTPGATGRYDVTARFWANTRFSRDTSVWHAMVADSSLSVQSSPDGTGNWIEASTTGSMATLRYAIATPGTVRVEIYNAAGELIETLADGAAEPGEHRAAWNTAGRAAGIYFCTISSGAWTRSVPIIVVR